MRKLLACLLFLALMGACAAPALAQEGTTVTLTFTGDCTLGANASWYNADTSLISVVEKNGLDYPFANLRSFFENDDLTVINLEGVLQDSASGKKSARKYNFRGPTEYVGMLTGSSIEACSLGNNHIEDFGSRGVKSTEEALTAANVGWFYNKDVFFFEKDGVKLAFLSYWMTDFNSHRKWLKSELPRLRQEEGVDFIVLCLHDGREHQFKHTKAVEEKARCAIDYGADLVIGNHPHVLQGLEEYNNRLIVYSLGNCVFGGSREFRENSMQTMLVRMSVQFGADGALESQQATLVPLRVSGEIPRNNYQPVVLGGAEAQAVIDLVQDDTAFALPAYEEGVGAVLDAIAAK